MEKVSLAAILKGYLETLRDDGMGRVSFADIFIQIVVPVLAGVAMFADREWFHAFPQGDGSVSTNVITGVSIASALLCAVDVLVFQLRFDMGQSEEPHLGRTVRLVDELFVDVLWAIVEGFIIVALLTVRGFFKGCVVDNVLLGVAVALLCNFSLVMCMSLKRMNAAYERVSGRQK